MAAPYRTIQLQRDTAANWTSANTLLAEGEVGLETNTRKAKIGDGVTQWNSLQYAFPGIAGVETLTSMGALINSGVEKAIPVDADMIGLMDSEAANVLKKLSWLNIKATLKTYFDTLYAKFLGDADFYKYTITTSVASGNLTVTVLNYLGATPSATAPVKYQDGSGTVRSITSALSVTANAATNYLNCGSAELATKEIDFFGYLQYNTTTSGTNLLISRITNATRMSDFVNSNTNEKGAIGIINYNTTDMVVNIGCFNAILSAGAGYTWSIPTTNVIINYNKPATRILDFVPTVFGSGGSIGAMATSIYEGKYQIVENRIFGSMLIKFTNLGSWTGGISVKLPMGHSGTNNIPVAGYVCASGSNPVTASRGYPGIDAGNTIIFLTAVDSSALTWSSMVAFDCIRISFNYPI